MMKSLLSCDEKWKSEVITLFLFYNYEASLQKTSTPKCTTSYAAKALRMSVRSIRRAKAELIKLRMIEDFIKSKTNEQGKNYLGYYINIIPMCNYYEENEVPYEKG